MNTKRILLSAFLSTAISIAVAQDRPPAVIPIQQDASWAVEWWMPRHEEKLAEAKERGDQVELLFIGDSITHGWDDNLWNDYFGNHEPFNLGFSGDRTEHVLWRFQHGALDNLNPKVTVLMIGTNNTGQGDGQPAHETLQGIEAIIDEINERLPDTHLILHAVFPRGASAEDPKRLENDKINAALPALAEEKGAEFLDINRFFVEYDGTLPRNVMPDLLHPNRYGYSLWAKALKPSLEKQFGGAEKTEPQIIVLWPKGTPQPVDASLTETAETTVSPIKGPVTRVTGVTEPTISFYKAESRGPAQAVLVCPGGGYNILAWDLEGEEVAEWLNSIGISAAVLKYRVNRNREGALQDAQRALGLLRSKADELNLDPNRIGVLGFSAGGHLSAMLSNHWRQRTYPKIDASDSVSCRPDFTVLVYPAYIGTPYFEFADDFKLDPDVPPAFIVQTQDDKRHFPSAIAYNNGLVKAGVPVELHTYPKGGHGYGLRPSAYPVSGWKDLCRDWLLRIESR